MSETSDAAALAVTAMTEYFQTQTVLNQIPTFDGKNTDLRNFVLEVENAYSLLGTGYDQNKFIKLILPKLKGIARESVEGKELSDLNSFTKHLKESFSTTTLPFGHYHSQLGQAKMAPTDTVNEFGLRIKELIKKCKAALSNQFDSNQVVSFMPLINSTALNGFLRGLRGDLELRVAIHKPSTLDEAIEYGRLEEQVAAERYTTRGPTIAHPPPFSRPFRPPLSGQRNYGYAEPLRPTFPPQPNERFVPRGPNIQLPTGSNTIQRDELNRPFMAPRNAAFASGHFRPPLPRYGEYPVRGTHYVHEWDQYYAENPSYYPYDSPNHFAEHPDNYMQSYHSYYPNEQSWGGYAPTLTSQPPTFPEHKEGEVHQSLTTYVDPSHSSNTSYASQAMHSDQPKENLNLTGARLNIPETSAPAMNQSFQKTQTFTVMKASRLQNQTLKQ